ncbi:MAG: rhodanese-like domain-containing protein [Magnetococcales bacterium]|nr:rhodanese-like domain-containing protein [Magnetococcales bacterium]
MIFHRHDLELPIEKFLVNPTAPILLDVRGSSDHDPTIPGSKRVYLLDLDERMHEFEKRFETQLLQRPLLVYCSKGEGSLYILKKFSKRFRVQGLKGGMVAYLETIARLLNEHPYEKPEKRDEIMSKLLMQLTDRQTPPDTFRKIINHLLRSSPDPEVRKWL